MKLSKLVLTAALTVGGVFAAQAAPNTAAIAAKLQTAAVVTPAAKLPPYDSKQEVRVYIKSLSYSERQDLIEQFADLSTKQQKALVKWYRNLPASPT